MNEQFDLRIDEDIYTTLGGYVLGRLGRRPRIGEAIQIEGREMRVITLPSNPIHRRTQMLSFPSEPTAMTGPRSGDGI